MALKGKQYLDDILLKFQSAENDGFYYIMKKGTSDLETMMKWNSSQGHIPYRKCDHELLEVIQELTTKTKSEGIGDNVPDDGFVDDIRTKNKKNKGR